MPMPHNQLNDTVPLLCNPIIHDLLDIVLNFELDVRPRSITHT